MKVKYYISAQLYGTEVNKALKKWYRNLALLAQVLAIIIWIVDYFISIDTYSFSEIAFVNIMTLLTTIFFAVLIYFIFNSWVPKLHNKFVVAKNHGNIGNITLELDADYLHVSSDEQTSSFKRNEVLTVSIVYETYCICSKYLYCDSKKS